MLRAFGGAEVAAMPRVEISDAVAPASTAVEKVRLFIIMTVFPLWYGWLEKFRWHGDRHDVTTVEMVTSPRY
jgi:hypothetical protein